MAKQPSLEVAQVCEEFRQALENGAAPKCNEFLGRVEPTKQRELLHQLLSIEAAQLPETDWNERLAEYRHTMSEYGDVLDSFETQWETLHTEISGEVSSEKSEEEAAELERIGDYKIIEVIGEGGMGLVYHAEQEEPVRRSVALKVIKQGLNSA
ncbi:MAG: hypothetical protein AAF394_18765, partial [Planctomycetota bacterium]